MIPVSLREKRKAGLTSSPRRADSYGKYVFSRTKYTGLLDELASINVERRSEETKLFDNQKKNPPNLPFSLFLSFFDFCLFRFVRASWKKVIQDECKFVCVTGEKLVNRWTNQISTGFISSSSTSSILATLVLRR